MGVALTALKGGLWMLKHSVGRVTDLGRRIL